MESKQIDVESLESTYKSPQLLYPQPVSSQPALAQPVSTKYLFSRLRSKTKDRKRDDYYFDDPLERYEKNN